MFILPDVYPALVITMLQMDGKGMGVEDVVRYLWLAPLSSQHQLMHIPALLCAPCCLNTLFAI